MVHPTALVAEADALAAHGIGDALGRLFVDPRCRVTTPFHQAAGRLREWLRGTAAHGSCGAGFGATVQHAIEQADEAVRWGDLSAAVHASDVIDRLASMRRTLRAGLLEAADEGDAALRAHAEWRVFDAGDDIAARWFAQARAVAARVAPGGGDAVLERLACRGTVVAEGAQGVLLGERHGFHPHTTWSRIDTASAEAALGEVGLPAEVVHLGVLRSYLTRHGAGPLPTEDRALDAPFAEPHNTGGGWQGRFRRGHADALLLRYAVAAAGRLDGIVTTHADALDRVAGGIGWCEAYRASGAPHDTRDPRDPPLCDFDPADPSLIVGLRLDPSPADDLAHGTRLGALLQQVVPEYAAARLRTAAELVDRLEAASGLPVVAIANGPTHAHVAWCSQSASAPSRPLHPSSRIDP